MLDPNMLLPLWSAVGGQELKRLKETCSCRTCEVQRAQRDADFLRMKPLLEAVRKALPAMWALIYIDDIPIESKKDALAEADKVKAALADLGVEL